MLGGWRRVGIESDGEAAAEGDAQVMCRFFVCGVRKKKLF